MWNRNACGQCCCVVNRLPMLVIRMSICTLNVICYVGGLVAGEMTKGPEAMQLLAYHIYKGVVCRHRTPKISERPEQSNGEGYHSLHVKFRKLFDPARSITRYFVDD